MKPMGIAVKAVIWKPDRHNDYVKLTKKKLVGTSFEHKECKYFIDSEHFQITSETPWWKFGFKRHFITYYYKQGVSKPIPVPDFGIVIKQDGKTAIPEIVDNGVPATELEALFNPYFLRIIAAMSQNIWDRLQFWITCGIAVVAIYAAWQAQQNHVSLEELKGLLQHVGQTATADPNVSASG